MYEESSLSYLNLGTGFFTFSPEATCLLTKNKPKCPILTEEILNNHPNELEWLSGFAEAESVFSISKTGTLTFRIKLHYDDRNTLVYIQNLLSNLAKRKVGVMVDSKNQHESYYSVSKFKDIVGVIIPIFSYFHFTTSKYFDFRDFKTAAEIKLRFYLENIKLSNTELRDILLLKSGMNTSRVNFDPYSLPKRTLTPYRLLGFVEGDGSFIVMASSLETNFLISQHSKNVHFFFEIAEFLKNLPYNPTIGPSSDVSNSKPNPLIEVRNNTEMAYLRVRNILQLYNYILPFFKSLEFKSRKIVDFQY